MSTIDKAYAHLRKDPLLIPFLDKYKVDMYHTYEQVSIHDELISSIISQQLSTKAAATIYSRFIDLFAEGSVSLPYLLDMDPTILRGVGLSNQKVSYVKNVAAYFLEPHNKGVDWYQLSDQDIIDKLVAIKGVGKWTVEMLLIFYFGRYDVLPVDDLVVRKGLLRMLGLEDNRKSLNTILDHAQQWQPYRTMVSKLMWAAKDDLS